MVRRIDKRLTILSQSELDLLYSLPKFNEEERAFYFTLNDQEITEVNYLRSLESQVYFILQLGFFKAKLILFSFTFSQAQEDVDYVLKRYFSNVKLSQKMITKRACFKIDSRILKLFSWNAFNRDVKEKAIQKASELARTCVDPRYIFDGLLDFLNDHSTSIPGYSTLQDIISQTLLEEEQRLQAVVSKYLPASVDEDLQKMLVSEGQKMYGITLLKKDAKGFNTKEILQEIKKKMVSSPLFKVAEQIIPKLGISEQNIYYYAYLVDYYTVDRYKETTDAWKTTQTEKKAIEALQSQINEGTLTESQVGSIARRTEQAEFNEDILADLKVLANQIIEHGTAKLDSHGDPKQYGIKISADLGKTIGTRYKKEKKKTYDEKTNPPQSLTRAYISFNIEDVIRQMSSKDGIKSWEGKNLGSVTTMCPEYLKTQ